MEQLEALRRAPSHADMQKCLNALGQPRAELTTHVMKPKTLMEMYQVDAGQIYRDVMDRRDHYSPEQVALAESMFFKRPLPTEPTRIELDDLFYRWTERTEQAQKRKEIIQKVTGPKDVADEAVLEGQTPKQPTFEEQNYEGLVKII
jgi:hypothetical protein